MRQFIASQAPDKKGLIKVSGKDYRYLRQVLRLKNGDMLSVRLPDGELQNTTVCEINEEGRIITLQICADTNNGSVTRGVCKENEEHFLTNITETFDIHWKGEKIVFEEDGKETEISKGTTVSMNFFGFTPSIMKELEERKDELEDVETAFSTWGMFSLTEDEIKKYLPSLKALF